MTPQTPEKVASVQAIRTTIPMYLASVIAGIILITAYVIYQAHNTADRKTAAVPYTNTACAGSMGRVVGAKWQTIHIPPRCTVQPWPNARNKIDIKTFPGGNLYPAGTRKSGTHISPVEYMMLRSATGKDVFVRISFRPFTEQ